MYDNFYNYEQMFIIFVTKNTISKKEVIMPGFDQTGPSGQGPMTGRRWGRCTNFGSSLIKDNPTDTIKQDEKQPENFQGRGFGLGRGRGWSGGRGMGRQNRFRGGF